MKKTKECEVYLFGQEQKDTFGQGKVRHIGIKPVYKTKGAAAADIATPLEVHVPPHKTVNIDLYVGFDIPAGYCIKLYPRSSLLVKRGLIQPVSIIDQDFSGNKIHAPVHNLTDEEVVLEAGERICQAMLEPVIDCSDWDHENNTRGAAGFGTTGTC